MLIYIYNAILISKKYTQKKKMFQNIAYNSKKLDAAHNTNK